MQKKKGAFKIDIEKYYFTELKTTKPTFRQKRTVWSNEFGLHCIAVFRLGQFSMRLWKRNKLIGLPFRVLYIILNYIIKIFYHVDIKVDATIGPGFLIHHVGTIYIRATIGENCSIAHNTTIGRGFTEGREGYPTIGKNVWIGTGATIVGTIEIGDGATISAGCVIFKDIPSNCLAAGNPGRVLLKDYDNRKMLPYRINNSNISIEE